jgi:hypothetical protein
MTSIPLKIGRISKKPLLKSEIPIKKKKPSSKE